MLTCSSFEFYTGFEVKGASKLDLFGAETTGDVKAVDFLMLPLPASLEVSGFRDLFHFLTLRIFCFRLQQKLITSVFICTCSSFFQNAADFRQILPLPGSASMFAEITVIVVLYRVSCTIPCELYYTRCSRKLKMKQKI